MHSGYTRLIQLRERFSARRIGKESASTQEIAAKREPGNRNNNTGTNATAAHRHSAWCTLSGPGHKFQNRCVHRRRSFSIFRFSPSTSLLSFPSVLPPPLSFLPLYTSLYHSPPPPYPSSDLCPFCSALPSQLRPLPLPSPPVPFLRLPSSSSPFFPLHSSLLLPLHLFLPVVLSTPPPCCPLSSLFLFSSLFSTSSTSARARPLCPTSPPHLTTQPDLFQHSSSPHFPSILSSPHVSSPLLLHSFSPLPLLFAWSPNLLSFSSLPPLFSSSLRHTLLLPFSLAPLASHITPSERSHPRGAKSTHLQTSRIFIALQILFQSRHYRPTTFALQDKPSVNPGSSIHLSTSYQHIINLSTMHFYLTCTTQRHRTSGCRFG